MPEETSKLIDWYRTPVDPATLKKLYERSDLMGWLQTGGYLVTLITTGSLCFYSWLHWSWPATLALLFLHGTCYAFVINAVHELGHGTVFKTKSLNVVFVHVFAFLGWINHRMFEASHVRHHRSTLHPPDDLEVVVPIKFTLKDFLRNAFISPFGIKHVIFGNLRIARGQFAGEWELKLFPEDNPKRRRSASNWAKTLLIGHGLLVAVSFALKLWMLPLLITLAPFYGGCLFFLCNNTQHVGLQDFSTDFRRCCRTFMPNPIVRFLYWHMNFHTEHHMYVGVPCYNLRELHQLIRYDVPAPKGIIGTWLEIGAILNRQKANPSYVYDPIIESAFPEVNAPA